MLSVKKTYDVSLGLSLLGHAARSCLVPVLRCRDCSFLSCATRGRILRDDNARGGIAWREEAMEARVISKVSRRIVPFVALCYFVCYLDRVNVGFAALQT